MMDLLINVIAFTFMASLTGYALALGVGNWKIATVNARTAHMERELLRRRIDQITDEQRIRREKSDASWNGFRKFEIMRKNPEGGGICSFYLTPHDKKPLPPFAPGQYLTFQLPIPGERKPVIRCYSLSDSPHHPNYYRVSIKAVPPPRDKPEAPPGYHQAHAGGAHRWRHRTDPGAQHAQHDLRVGLEPRGMVFLRRAQFVGACHEGASRAAQRRV